MTGGKGLDKFRESMLNDKRIRSIHDYLDAHGCFPSVAIEGGICYFMWDKDWQGKCNFGKANVILLLTRIIRSFIQKGTCRKIQKMFL